MGALTSAMFIIAGPAAVGGMAVAALAANETLKQTNMISESTASKVFTGTIFSAASAPVDWGEAIHEGISDLIPDMPGVGGIPEEGKQASNILKGIVDNDDAK